MAALSSTTSNAVYGSLSGGSNDSSHSSHSSSSSNKSSAAVGHECVRLQLLHTLSGHLLQAISKMLDVAQRAWLGDKPTRKATQRRSDSGIVIQLVDACAQLALAAALWVRMHRLQRQRGQHASHQP